MGQDERQAKMEEKQGDTPTKQHCCNNQLVIMGKKRDIIIYANQTTLQKL